MGALKIIAFLKEARRRRVFPVTGIYIVGAWITVQVCSEVFPALDIPANAIRFVWLGVILGFPLSLLFSWFYDVTTEGIVRTPPAGTEMDVSLGLRRVDYLILVGLAVLAVGIVLQLGSRIREADVSPGSQVLVDADPMSIAVLPLENLSGEQDQAYFVNGMHDALITGLSRISGLRVTSRTSTRGYANTSMPIRQIGLALGVSMIIEGSVYRVGDRVRIVVQLIDTLTDQHLWAETYERDMADVLMMQSDITRAITREVQVTLTTEESRGLSAARTVDPASFEAYLKGMFHLELFTPKDMQLAMEHFQRAVELDPDNALAHWGLSRLCRFQLQAGLIRPREGEPRCREPLLRAFELDNKLAEVHLGLALGYWVYDYNWDAAEASFLHALEINPNYAEANMFYSHFLATMGRAQESTEQMLKARSLDPLNTFIQGLHGVQMALIGSLEEGIDEINAALSISPNLGFGYDVLWFANARLGKHDEALEAAEKHFGLTMGNQAAVVAMEDGFEAGGFEGAMLQAAETVAELSEVTYIPAIEIATLYELGGDVDKCFEWLNVAYDQHDPTLPYIGAAPLFGEAYDDPRYADLLRRMNLIQWLSD